jgi:hypothetical protein
VRARESEWYGKNGGERGRGRGGTAMAAAAGKGNRVCMYMLVGKVSTATLVLQLQKTQVL